MMVAEVYSHLQYDCMSEQQLSKIWLSQSVAPAAAHSELFGQVQQLVVWTNMGVPQNAGTPKWLVCSGKSCENGWFWGNPIMETLISYYLHTICSSSLRLAKHTVSGLKPPPPLHPMVINPPDLGSKCKSLTGMVVCRESKLHEHMHTCWRMLYFLGRNCPPTKLVPIVSLTL